MGANQQTSVPAFTAGQVLTAQQQTEINTGIPVFADSTARTAAFGGTGEKVLAEGQYSYLEDTDATEVYDGSSWVSVGTAPGLVLISTHTFTSVASFSLPNDTFTATYDHYKLQITMTALTGTGIMRLRTAGTDNTAATYKYASAGATSYATSTYASINSNGTTSFDDFMQDAATPYSWQGWLDVMSPVLSDRTVIAVNYANITKARPYIGIFNNTTSFDSLSLSASSISGKITVYGYAK